MALRTIYIRTTSKFYPYSWFLLRTLDSYLYFLIFTWVWKKQFKLNMAKTKLLIITPICSFHTLPLSKMYHHPPSCSSQNPRGFFPHDSLHSPSTSNPSTSPYNSTSTVYLESHPFLSFSSTISWSKPPPPLAWATAAVSPLLFFLLLFFM